MTPLWFVFAAVAVVAAAGVALPLLRRRPPAPGNEAADVDFYRRQLAEVAADEARGLLGGEESAAARLEVERRLLRAAPRRDASKTDHLAAARTSAATRHRRWPALLIVALVPAAALAIYSRLGQPELPDLPFAARPQPGAAEQDMAANEQAMLERAVPALERRLEKNPDDRLALEMLGRAQMMLGRYADAARTMERQQALGDDDPAMIADYGEALVGAANGEITDAARAAFERALAADAGNLKARYYIAFAEARAGRLDVAIQDWVDLVTLSPPDAPWMPAVHRMLEAAAAQQGIDLSTVTPRVKPPGS